MNDSCCSIPAPSLAAMPDHAPNLLGQDTPEDLAECPVMKGSTVVKSKAEAAGLYRDVDGVRYWFCCAGCGPKFDADPAAYIAA
ncbi:hypothetical protein [Agromyces aureus]|uniref:YHS domain-containing protein n=1 Tax=Agromyces aureus TaxID=453304 RepID=A0A191WC18_9MICO|nr:hypothetical protein ATC03_02145 [Agromyces aureus]